MSLNSCSFNSAGNYFKKIPIVTLCKQILSCVVPDCVCVSAVAFTDVEAKVILRVSKCQVFTVWVLGIHHIRKYWELQYYLPHNCTQQWTLFSSLSAPSTWIICWFTVHRWRVLCRVAGSQQWLWLVSPEDMQSALSDGFLSLNFTEWPNEEAQGRI